MEDEISKKNLTKVLSLFTLRLRKMAGQEWTGAGEIAEMAGVNRDSLYVLLSRWLRWEYVKANRFSTPRLYSLASHGSHYLDQLDRWYPHRNTVFRVVAENAKISFFWFSVNPWTQRPTKLNVISYPFKQGCDYMAVKPNAEGKFLYEGESLLKIRKAGCLQALYGVRDDLKLTWGDGLIDKLAVEGFIRRKQ